MKRLLIIMALICAGTFLFAQVTLPEHYFAAGNWTWVGSRLYQNDASSGLAKMNLRAAQSGPMWYEFNARYEKGLEDGHGGIGLHIFGDSAYNGPSWGAGRSMLLWLNYDEKPVTSGFPSGLTAQVYRSLNNSQMEQVESFDLNWVLPLITQDFISRPIPFKIWVDGDTGEVRVYDPFDSSLTGYYHFFLDQKDIPLRGNWVSLRTNGISASFGMGL